MPTGGTYHVVAASAALDPHAALVPVADRPVRHDIVLSAGSAVHGLVTSGADAAPVPGASITLIDVQGVVAGTTRSDGGGRYRIHGVPDGRYTPAATVPGHPPPAVSVRLSRGRHTERDLALPARAVLRGTVISTGALVGHALATLVDAEGRVVASAVTGPDGTFEFADLPAGTYPLTACGYDPVAQVVHVAAGTVATAVVELVPPSAEADPVNRMGERAGGSVSMSERASEAVS